MVIQINTEFMLKAGLTGTQYMLLELLRTRKDKLIRQYIDFDPNGKKDILRLKELGFVLKMDKTGYLINQKEVSKVLDLEDNFFWEIFSTYPIKVYNGNVTRILRNSSPDAKEAKECLKKYRSKVKTVAHHKRVLNCLEVELAMRKKEKNLGFMQKLVTWLNQSSWEQYESFVDEAGSLNLDNTDSYGGGLV